jgi:hypothetical protein
MRYRKRLFYRDMRSRFKYQMTRSTPPEPVFFFRLRLIKHRKNNARKLGGDDTDEDFPGVTSNVQNIYLHIFENENCCFPGASTRFVNYNQS